MTTGLEYGGYDYVFVGNVLEKLKCIICTKVQRDPHITSCCGQHFCESCLENWFRTERQTSCPHCRKQGFSHFLNKDREREINELKVCCTNHLEGCQWIGKLGTLQTHLQPGKAFLGCEYMEILCPNKCEVYGFTTTLKRRALQDHLQICYLRQYKCEYCSAMGTYYSITGNGPIHKKPHYDHCPEYPLKCPNKCGENAIKRKDMSIHRKECPLELVKCPNRCKCNHLKRKDLENHLVSECINRQYTCEYCGDKDTYQVITGITYDGNIGSSHYDQCPKKPLECPKCNATIERYDMSSHLEAVCPEEWVECPFKKVGCAVNVARKDLAKHMTSNQEVHLQAAVETLTTAVNELRSEIRLLPPTNPSVALSLKCMETTLCLGRPTLASEGDSISFRISSFSDYQVSGTVWRSPPFYVTKGYKMCLEARYFEDFGQQRSQSLTLSLFLMKGESDDQLGWPFTSTAIGITPTIRTKGLVGYPTKEYTTKYFSSGIKSDRFNGYVKEIKIEVIDVFKPVLVSNVQKYTCDDTLYLSLKFAG